MPLSFSISQLNPRDQVDVRVLHQHIRSQDTAGEDSSGGFSSAVRGADGGEDDGDGAADGSKEGLESS